MRYLPLFLLFSFSGFAQQPGDSCLQLDAAQLYSSDSAWKSTCIETAEQNPNDPNISLGGSQSKILHGTDYVVLKSGFQAGAFTGDAGLHIKADKRPMEVVFLEPVSPNAVPQLEKLELGIRLDEAIQTQVDAFLQTGSGLNPYEENDLLITADFLSPFGLTDRTRYAFHYRDYQRNEATNGWDEQPTLWPFRVRFAPNIPGPWRVAVRVRYQGAQAQLTLFHDTLDFTCVPSSNPGFLQLGSNGYQLRYSKTHESFFGVGVNIAGKTPDCVTLGAGLNLHLENMAYWQQFVQADVNFARVWIGHTIYTPELEELGNYNMRQPFLWEFDNLLQFATQHGVYLRIVLENGIDFVNTNPYGCTMDWDHNPYKSIIGSAPISDFFTNTYAKHKYRQKLRYIISRWGYSTNVAMWELFNEVDGVAGTGLPGGPRPFDEDTLIRQQIIDWHDEMLGYMRTDLQASQLFTASVADWAGDARQRNFELYDLPWLNVVSLHMYGTGRNRNIKDRWAEINAYRNRYSGLLGQPHKPIQIDEYGPWGDHIGIRACDPTFFHNDIWASAMMGSFSVGLYWRHDHILPQGLHHKFDAVTDFFETVDFEEEDYMASRIPEQDDEVLDSDPLAHPIEVFYQSSQDGHRAFGWVHNRTDFWWTHQNTNPCLADLIAQNPLTFNSEMAQTPSGISQPISMIGQTIKIKGLNIGTKYSIKWINTSDNSVFYSQSKRYLGIGGFNITVPNLDDNPRELAFKIVRFSEGEFKFDSVQIAQIASQQLEQMVDGEEVVSIYPNPTRTRLRINWVAFGDFKVADITIFDLAGRTVFSEQQLPSGADIEIDKIANGVYLVLVEFPNGKALTSKIFVTDL